MFSNPTENATLTANFKKKCPIYLKNYQNLFKNCRGYDGEIGTKFQYQNEPIIESWCLGKRIKFFE